MDMMMILGATGKTVGGCNAGAQRWPRYRLGLRQRLRLEHQPGRPGNFIPTPVDDHSDVGTLPFVTN
ncbi:MAG: hypothetical protein ACOH1Y_12115 [Propionicimonas sp.]